MNPVVYVAETNNPSSFEVATTDPACVGTIEHREDGYYIAAAGPGAERIAGLREGSYATVEDCLDAISIKTGGICRRWQP
jgi:hypothetical protein